MNFWMKVSWQKVQLDRLEGFHQRFEGKRPFRRKVMVKSNLMGDDIKKVLIISKFDEIRSKLNLKN